MTKSTTVDGTCISSGNAAQSGASTREWFTGPFIPPHTGLRSAPVMLKWSSRRKGWRRGWSEPSDGTSMTLLVSGSMRMEFAGSGEGKIVLTRPGDYVMWCPGTRHDCEAMSDCTVLTVRWSFG